ncbi:hypothetical protein D918_00379 [Trichuris suis]|nr:hypothetical protein D918_00379 [Trichuris suis]
MHSAVLDNRECNAAAHTYLLCTSDCPSTRCIYLDTAGMSECNQSRRQITMCKQADVTIIQPVKN